MNYWSPQEKAHPDLDQKKLPEFLRIAISYKAHQQELGELLSGSSLYTDPAQPRELVVVLQWGTSDAKIKNPPGGSQELSKVPSKSME